MKRSLTPHRVAAPPPAPVKPLLTAEDLHAALERDQLYLCYQPKIDVRSGVVMGAEALVRWDHPEHGVINPGDFIPLAEQTGLIVPLGTWVVERACQQLSRWQDSFDRPFKVWVNLAAASLGDGPRVVEEVEDALARWNVDPHLFGVEVTESTVIQNMVRGSAILRELRRLGIEIALDDFGTGYSSLTYLRRLPITWVKIDRSFVSGVGSSLADAAIVEAVIDLSHALGLAVVAEGVENTEQLAELRELGADRVQGFLFSAPVLPSVLESLVTKPWAGAQGIVLPRSEHDLRTESLPGHGGPRARLLLSALDAVSDAVAVFDAKASLFENRVVYINSAAEDLLTIDAEDVEGELFSDVFRVEAPGEFGLTKFENAARSSLVARGELALGPKDGALRPVDVTFTALSDSTGVQTNWLATFRDLSEKKALAADRGRLAHAIDRSGTGVALYDAVTGRITYASESLETMVGAARGSIVGTSIDSIFVPPHPLALLESQRPESSPALGEEASATAVLRGGSGAAIPVRFEIVQHLDDPRSRPLESERPSDASSTRLERDGTSHRALLVHDRRAEVRRFELQQLALDFARAGLGADPTGPEAIAAELFDFCGEVHRLLECDGVWFNVLAELPILSRYGHASAGPFQERFSVTTEQRRWLGESLAQPTDYWRGEGLDLEGYVRAWLPRPDLARRTELVIRCGGNALGVLAVARITPLLEDEVVFLRQAADTMANLLERARLSKRRP